MNSTKTNKITEFQKNTLLELKIQMQNRKQNKKDNTYKCSSTELSAIHSLTIFFPLKKYSSKKNLFPIRKRGNFTTFLNNYL